MKTNNLWSPQTPVIGSFLLCLLVAGIPFWKTPYNSLNVPNSFYGIGAIAVFSIAAILAYRFSFRQGLIIPALAFPAVLMIRVVVEGIIEPSRHNLWPLALVIAAVSGLVVAGMGAILGWLVSRLLR